MVKTYILAPNWSTAPPPDGPLSLGHLLAHPTDLTPLAPALPPPAPHPTDTKTRFGISRSQLTSHSLKVFAQALSLLPGGSAQLRYSSAASDVLACAALDTLAFDPSPDYVAACMACPEVQRFMAGARFRAPVYLVTGLKVARGASLQRAGERERAVTLEAGGGAPGGVVQLGAAVGVGVLTSEGESWEASTDFVVALRLRKIWYARGGVVKSKLHLKDVIMQTAEEEEDEEEEQMTLRQDDEVGVEDAFVGEALKLLCEVEDGEEVNWILPDIGLESGELPTETDA